MDRIEAMRLFVRLAARKTFSAAASDLKIKQSTASKWVAELEAELNVALVQRTTRALQLTEAGERYLGHASQVLAAYDAMERDLRARSTESSGRVRLSLPVVFGRLFIAAPVARFLAKNPRVEAELVFGDRYVSLVEEGFDLAIRVGIPTDTSARGRKLAESRRFVVAAPSYLEARGEPQRPAELKKHECLIHGDATNGAIWRFSPERGRAVPVSVRGRIGANNSEAVLELARRGLGIALLADWLVAADLRKGTVVPLLERFRAPPAPVYALTPPGRFPSPVVRALVDDLAANLARRLEAVG